MEALSAVSLAGNVAQFLEYGIRVIRKAREIANSRRGISEEVSEAEFIVNDLHETLALIQEQFDSGVESTRKDETLQHLVQSCLSVASQLTQIIEKLQLKSNAHEGSRSRQAYDALHKAALVIHKKAEMDQLFDRLLNLRTQISSHLIVLIEKQQRELQSTLLAFSSTTDQFQTRFQALLGLSLKYLQRISENMDSLVVNPSSVGKKAYKNLVARDYQEHHVWSTYQAEIAEFLDRDLRRLMDDKKKSILKSLSFGQLHDRESAIPDAHRRTFEWMLAPHTDQNFTQWLSQETGTFWVSGKAGAGKSTLMKFLVEHATTRKKLAAWAGGDLIVAKHFFWRPGTPLQKSQEGLFRSLLLQVLTQQSELIPLVCSERWLAPYSESFLPWSRSQLVKAMENLKSAIGGTGDLTGKSFKLCLFIDGLDEFEGDPSELIRVLSDFTDSAHIKMCASSRPWLEFSDAFGNRPWKVQVHDLTRNDMLTYLRDQLEADGKFARLRSRSPELASGLITKVVNQAEGVFLWLYLVTQSLLRGLRYEDDIRDLKRRIEDLPPDLETYFSRMLNSIEGVYRQRTSRMFLTLSIARTSLAVMTFFFLNFDDEAAHVDPHVVGSLQTWPDVDPVLVEALETKKRQLIAQCKDIIHVTPDRNAPLLFGETIGFLHRTVYDFLNTEEIYRYLEKLAGPLYEPKKPLFEANIIQVQAMIHLYPRTFIKPHLNSWILGTLFYAYEMEVTSSGPVPNYINNGLDRLDQIISKEFSQWDFQHAVKTLLNKDFISFINLTAVCDLASYVEYKCVDITPEKLDSIAPGWRSPCRVQQLGTFEIIPQTSDIHWRLGNALGVTFPVGPREVSGESVSGLGDKIQNDADTEKHGEETMSPRERGARAANEKMAQTYGYPIGNRGRVVHRGLRKFASLWHRS